MTLLLCLILVGQSMASSVMVYKMAGMDMASMNSASMENMAMDHSQMSISATDSATDSSVDDCCAKKCQCFASGCSTISAFSKVVSPDIVTATAKIYNTPLLVLSQALTSLYRPPILS